MKNFILALFLFVGCTKAEQLKVNVNQIENNQNNIFVRKSNLLSTSSSGLNLQYSGDPEIQVYYNSYSHNFEITFHPLNSNTPSEPWYLTVTSPYVTIYPSVTNKVETTSTDNSITHTMEQGDFINIIVESDNNEIFSGTFADIGGDSSTPIINTTYSSPFPHGGFHWTISTDDPDTAGLIHINWKVPNNQDFPTLPSSSDKYYFYYSMADAANNTSLHYVDSTSIFDGHKSLGKPYYNGFDSIRVKLYIKGIRLKNDNYYIEGTSNGEFVLSYGFIQDNSYQEFAALMPGCEIRNGNVSYSPVNINWR